ncbi:MAG: glycosyltransferase family 4 protein [Phycisphaerae bacterium]|nr:glycosyltransferase family 4 protein [Phycisphaerae bacterium]
MAVNAKPMKGSPAAGPPRLVVMNQVAATLTIDLLKDFRDRGVACRALAGEYEATPEQLPGVTLHNGRRLIKHRALFRLWTWLVFSLQGLWTVWKYRREDMLIVTSPPSFILAMPLLKRLFGVRYSLLIYDIYPEVAERLGMIRPGGWIARLWRKFSRKAMLDARSVITLGSDMADTLRGHLRPGDELSIEIVPTWVDPDVIRPVDRSENPFVREHGLADKFVVMYSGSFGATHDIASLVETAGLMAEESDVHFMLIGGGTRQVELSKLVASRGLKNLTLLPHQPRDVFPYSLASADCQVVSLDEAYAGLSIPSKTYCAMAAGCAVIAVSPPESDLTTIITEGQCGLHVPPRNPEALVTAIRRLRDDAALLNQCKQRGRHLAEERFSREPNLEKFFAVLKTSFDWRRYGMNNGNKDNT